VPLYADRGVATAMLPRVTIALGLGTLVGRLISGVLLDHIEARLVGAGTFAIGTAAIVWLAFAANLSDPLMVVLPPAIVGLALGAETDILAYFVRRLFGLAHYPIIYNRLLIAYYFGGIIGPAFVGWGFDYFGDPKYALLAVAASCALAMSSFLLLPNMRAKLATA